MRSGAWWPSEAPPPPALRPGDADDDSDDGGDDGVDGDDYDDNGGGTIHLKQAPSLNVIHTPIKTYVKQQKQIYNNKTYVKQHSKI